MFLNLIMQHGGQVIETSNLQTFADEVGHMERGSWRVQIKSITFETDPQQQETDSE